MTIRGATRRVIRPPIGRQARDESGRLTYLGGFAAQRDLIADLPVVDVITGSTLSVSELD
ncbi:MAG: hypothetical protein ACHQ3P_01830 [Candidatus Limnocylindrales bacterium]